MPLRDYQEDAVQSLFRYFDTRTGNPLVELPTGAGKSIVQAEFIRRAIDMFPETRIICLTHVKELIDQNAKALIKWAPDMAFKVGINSAGLGRRDLKSQVLFAGIQSVHRRAAEIGRADLVMVDEAHLIPKSGTGMYRRFLEEMKEINEAVKVIGFTATPYRLGGGMLTSGEGKIFSSVCHKVSVDKLIDDGHLSTLISHENSVHYDTSGVGTSGGDFKIGELANMVNESVHVTQKAVEQICKEGIEGEREGWLIFCASVEQAREVVRMVSVPAQLITGDTDTATRDQIIQAFKSRQLRCLVNVNVLTTGFDAPHVDLIGLLRPTQSPGLYVQMLGRGMRIAEDKINCLVLDYGDNINRHGPINDIRPPRQPMGDGVAVVKSCPQCYYEGIPGGMMTCPECGFEFPLNDPKLSRRSLKDVIARPTRKWARVTKVQYSRHTKQDRPDSMRVDYFGGLNKIASEWVCIEHEGYAGRKAFDWLSRRLGAEDFPPASVGAAIEMGRSGQLKEPDAILVDVAKRYPDIQSYAFEGLPAGLMEEQ